MQTFNLRVELELRLPVLASDRTTVIDPLLDLLEPFGGVVSRTAEGRVELLFGVPAMTLHQAASAGLALITAEGYSAFAAEVMPQAEFIRRAHAASIPELVSVPQAAKLLGIKRQSALELVQRGRLAGVKVGDTWVIPRSAVEARLGVAGLRWVGTLLPTDVVVMALAESPQVCSSKVPTRERCQVSGRRVPVAARRRVSVRAWWSRRR